jgi:hypothetical protein
MLIFLVVCKNSDIKKETSCKQTFKSYLNMTRLMTHAIRMYKLYSLKMTL